MTNLIHSRHGAPVTDQAITQLENNVISQAQVGQLGAAMGKVDLSGSSKQSQAGAELFPYRPAYATSGQNVTVWANYFKVQVKTPVLWRYTVDITQKVPPPKAGSTVKGRKLALVMQKVYDHFASSTRALATEYKSQLISLDKLKLDSQSVSIELPRESGDEKGVFDVKINGPIELRMGDMQDYLKAQDRGHEANLFPRFPECVDALNIILSTRSRGLIDNMSVVGHARYFPFGPETPADFQCNLMRESGRPLIASRGFFQSTRLGTGRLLLNTNVTCGVFRVSGPLVKIFQDLGWQLSYQGRPNHAAMRQIRQGAGLLAKARVQVKFKDSKGTLIKRNKAIYGLVARKDFNRRAKGKDDHPPIIEGDADYPGPTKIKFWLQDESGAGKYVTVAQHFKNKYNMVLGDYPVVNMGNAGKPVFFPAEVIDILPGQAVKAKLTGPETSSMLLHACKFPKENATILENTSRALLRLDDDLPSRFSVEVDKKLLAVHARVLGAPTILYGAGSKSTTMRPNGGSWNMSNVKVFRGAKIDRWACFQISTPRSSGLIDKKNIDDFVQTARNIGIQMGAPFKPIEDIPSDHNVEQILHEKFKWAANNAVRFILFVFSPVEDKDGAYNMIKTLGDCTYGVHTSCIVDKKFNGKFNAPYFSNVLLKWNLKAGGVNHKLSQDVALIKEGKTMVVGYDVTHPTNLPGGGKGKNLPPSLVGVVSSVDKDLGQWPSTVWEQASKQEMLDDTLIGAFKECLVRWEGRTATRKPLPENIIIFRDGVSEGQFAKVLEDELPKIREACRLKYPKGKVPKLAIIVSVKRHQTRFYPAESGKESKTGNIECGTVVDRDVTQARYWDFYLTAHTALQGTARPAHYTVLLDDIFRAKFQNRAADELEKLTHEMCYLFGRATKAISICPPAYYADIVCERARLHRPEYDFDDTRSESTAVSGQPSQASSGAIQIHPNLKESMYYI